MLHEGRVVVTADGERAVQAQQQHEQRGREMGMIPGRRPKPPPKSKLKDGPEGRAEQRNRCVKVSPSLSLSLPPPPPPFSLSATRQPLQVCAAMGDT